MRKQWPDSTIAAVELRLEEEEKLRDAGATYVSIMDWIQWVTLCHFPPNKTVISIGNPPFSLAQKHIESSFDFFPTKSLVIYLLRFSFFGGKLRNQEFWKQRGLKFLKYVIPIAPRPSFKKGVTDNSEYAVYVWEKDYQGVPVITDSILWQKKSRFRVPKP